MKYLPRVLDSELDLRLRSVGATLIVGPKWCGKTTTAKQKAASVLEMQDPDLQEGYLKLADTKPSLLLQGDKPRLIDEWQLAPVLWDAVRVSVDRSSEKGLYILTGSVVKDDSKTKHTGTGRISRLEMLPMSLWESKESTGPTHQDCRYHQGHYGKRCAYPKISVYRQNLFRHLVDISVQEI